MHQLRSIGRTFRTTPTTFEVRRDGPTTATVVATGELDLISAPRLEEVVVGLLDHDVRWIALDAGAVEFIDCSGLRALVQAAQRCARDRGDFSVVAASAKVERLLELGGQRRLRTARRRPAA